MPSGPTTGWYSSRSVPPTSPDTEPGASASIAARSSASSASWRSAVPTASRSARRTAQRPWRFAPIIATSAQRSRSVPARDGALGTGVRRGQTDRRRRRDRVAVHGHGAAQQLRDPRGQRRRAADLAVVGADARRTRRRTGARRCTRPAARAAAGRPARRAGRRPRRAPARRSPARSRRRRRRPARPGPRSARPAARPRARPAPGRFGRRVSASTRSASCNTVAARSRVSMSVTTSSQNGLPSSAGLGWTSISQRTDVPSARTSGMRVDAVRSARPAAAGAASPAAPASERCRSAARLRAGTPRSCSRSASSRAQSAGLASTTRPRPSTIATPEVIALTRSANRLPERCARCSARRRSVTSWTVPISRSGPPPGVRSTRVRQLSTARPPVRISAVVPGRPAAPPASGPRRRIRHALLDLLALHRALRPVRVDADRAVELDQALAAGQRPGGEIERPRAGPGGPLQVQRRRLVGRRGGVRERHEHDGDAVTGLRPADDPHARQAAVGAHQTRVRVRADQQLGQPHARSGRRTRRAGAGPGSRAGRRPRRSQSIVAACGRTTSGTSGATACGAGAGSGSRASAPLRAVRAGHGLEVVAGPEPGRGAACGSPPRPVSPNTRARSFTKPSPPRRPTVVPPRRTGPRARSGSSGGVRAGRRPGHRSGDHPHAAPPRPRPASVSIGIVHKGQRAIGAVDPPR